MDARDALKRIAFLVELTGGNPMRARAFANAARTLKKVPDLDAARRRGELAGLPGIGKGILAVVDAALAARPIEALTELQEQVPAGLPALGALPGLGPKKVRVLWEALGITSIAGLEEACRRGDVAGLPGFGEALQDKLAEAIAARKATAGLLRLDRADAIAADVLRRLRALPEVVDAQPTGALRRRAEVVPVVALLLQHEGLNAALLDGEPFARDGLAWARLLLEDAVVEIALVDDPDRLGAASVIATGSPAHVSALRARAGELGGTLTGEDGLTLGGRPEPCCDEEELYRALGLLPTAPERREEGVPLARIGTARPRLLRREDLRGAIHNHTLASDGLDSLPAMRAAAARAGLEYLAITEHSEASAYAGGLDAARLLAQKAEIDALPDGPCAVLAGVESDILQDGALDYPDEVLGALDLVVASVHRRHGLDAEAATARMVAAARHPRTDVIGHPLGRLLLDRPAVEFDVRAMIEAAAAAGCAVECNGNPQRLDLPVEWLALCKELGVLVSVAADAHSTAQLDYLDFAVGQARRAGLTAEDVLNARPLPELRAWLAARWVRAAARVGAC